MEIAGFIKNSFLDYPGLIAAVVFVPGCNMDCWYCHNRSLWGEENRIDPADIDAFLNKRQGFIDGVVITGGEPTLQHDLKEYVLHIKDKGYLVKLDTNGLRPNVVKKLLPHIDYIAMDLKAPPGEISRVVSLDIDENKIWQTADMIMDSNMDYEFRTTMMPMLSEDDIVRIAQRISSAKKYALQQYRKTGLKGALPNPLSAAAVAQAADAARQYINNVIVRGV